MRISEEADRLDGKVAAIGGGARGIGFSIAHTLGNAGARVWICDIDAERSKASVARLRKESIDARFMETDLEKRDGPQEMVRRVVDADGQIDILINNAKAGQRMGLFEETEENWDITVSVIQRAAFFASQEAIRSMKRTGGGSIVNVSSVAALCSCDESPSYHSAKAALTQITRYLAQMAGGYGVRVNCVLPGFIVKDEDRPRYDREDNVSYRQVAEFVHPIRRVGSSDEVARAVLFLASDNASFITGHSLLVDGGLTGQGPFEMVSRFIDSQIGS